MIRLFHVKSENVILQIIFSQNNFSFEFEKRKEFLEKSTPWKIIKEQNQLRSNPPVDTI